MTSLVNAVGNLVKKVATGESAADYKSKIDAEILRLDQEVANLSGKDHHKERTAIGKQVAALRSENRYIDACRVAKGLAPAHGHFVEEVTVDGDQVPKELAAKIARETEQALQEMEPVPKPEPSGDAEKRRDWQDRIAVLEKKVASEVGHQTVTAVPAVTPQDAVELEAIAQEVVDYKDFLKKSSGYTNKSLKEDRELAKLEERLDRLASFLQSEDATGPTWQWKSGKTAPEADGPPPIAVVVAQLADRERQLARRLARHREERGLSAAEVRESEGLLVKLAERKAYLRSEGLTEKEQDKDEDVMGWLIRLQEIREKEIHDKKRSKHLTKEMEADLHELVKLEEDLVALRADMKAERDCSNKDLKHDPALGELEERLVVLRRFAV